MCTLGGGGAGTEGASGAAGLDAGLDAGGAGAAEASCADGSATSSSASSSEAGRSTRPLAPPPEMYNAIRTDTQRWARLCRAGVALVLRWRCAHVVRMLALLEDNGALENGTNVIASLGAFFVSATCGTM